MTQKNNLLIVGICATAAVIITIIISIIALQKSGINDSYFVSDGSKLVIDLDGDAIASDDGATRPVKGYTIYYYSGDTITNMKTYYEYANEENAKTMLKYYQDNGSDEFKSAAVDGKYLILTANESRYDGISTEDVKQNIKFVEDLQSVETDTESENAEDTEDEENYEIDIEED